VLENSVGASLPVSEEGSYTVVTTIDGCAGEGSSPVDIITTGIEEPDHLIRCYPNPATGILYVDVQNTRSGIARIELLDGTGRSLEFRDVPAGSTSVFDLNNYGNGMLLIKMTMDEKTVVSKVLSY
jgi:hypothetical protein